MDKLKIFEKLLKALANRRRLEILTLLKYKNQMSVGRIADEIKLSFKSTSRHLSVLSNADFLDKKQVGLTVLYSISKNCNSLARKVLEFL